LIKNLDVYPETWSEILTNEGSWSFPRKPAGPDPGGVSREDATGFVQKNAMKVWEEGKEFQTELWLTGMIGGWVRQGKRILRQNYHLKACGNIFKLVFVM
jgi:adenylosuccinate lyase